MLASAVPVNSLGSTVTAEEEDNEEEAEPEEMADVTGEISTTARSSWLRCGVLKSSLRESSQHALVSRYSVMAVRSSCATSVTTVGVMTAGIVSADGEEEEAEAEEGEVEDVDSSCEGAAEVMAAGHGTQSSFDDAQCGPLALFSSHSKKAPSGVNTGEREPVPGTLSTRSVLSGDDDDDEDEDDLSVDAAFAGSLT